jgi:hypothetical protein
MQIYIHLYIYTYIQDITIPENLPVIPDVTIQYTCDNVDKNQQKNGFLPFHAIADVIPDTSKYIYVLTGI